MTSCDVEWGAAVVLDGAQRVDDIGFACTLVVVGVVVASDELGSSKEHWWSTRPTSTFVVDVVGVDDLSNCSIRP